MNKSEKPITLFKQLKSKRLKISNIYVVDAGNTSLKVAVFEKDELISVHRYRYETFFQQKLSTKDSLVVISSVLNDSDTQKILSLFKDVFHVTTKVKTPLSIAYETPETLGVDRLANAVYAYSQNPKGNVLVIDIGTCVKYDFVTKGIYKGGAISPGIKLRYRSLHEFTGNLPLIKDTCPASLIGRKTSESIHSGVMNGIKVEIEGIIDNYARLYGELDIFVTGGDARFFDLRRKNNIFADENITLKGLYEIYKMNA